jgi:hypothetical protein
VAEAAERTRYGRNGVYDVTVRRTGEIVAEFRGQSMMMSGRPGAAASRSRVADRAPDAGPGASGERTEPAEPTGPAA